MQPVNDSGDPDIASKGRVDKSFAPPTKTTKLAVSWTNQIGTKGAKVKWTCKVMAALHVKT